MQLNNKFILFMDVYYIIIIYDKFIYINLKKNFKIPIFTSNIIFKRLFLIFSLIFTSVIFYVKIFVFIYS